MKKIKVDYTPSFASIEIDMPMKGFWEWEFLKLSRQFKHHYCDDSEKKANCFICEALANIEQGQMEVGLMLTGRAIEQDKEAF